MKKCSNCGKLLSSNYVHFDCIECIQKKEQKTEYELKILIHYKR